MYIYKYMYIYIYIYMYIYIYIYIYIYMCVYIYIYHSIFIYIAIRRGDNTPTNKICRRAPWAAHEQDRITKIVSLRLKRALTSQTQLSRSWSDLVRGRPVARDGRSCS